MTSYISIKYLFPTDINGSQVWTGMMGAVAYNEADIAICGLAIVQTRGWVAYPSEAISKEGIQVQNIRFSI